MTATGEDATSKWRTSQRPLVMHIIPALVQGGAERWLVELKRLDRDRDHQIVTLAGTAEFDINGQPVPHAGLGLPRSRWSALAVPFAALRLVRLIRSQKPQVVVGWLYYGALMTIVASLMRRPVVWSLHAADFDIRQSFRWPTRLAIRACGALSGRVPTTIHYCSEAGRRTHSEIGFDTRQSIVIANGVDLAAFTPAKTERSSRDEVRVIGCAARFDPQKDLPTLFAALAELRKRGRNVRLQLAGSGCVADNAALADALRAAGVASDVELLGPVTDMPAFYRSIDTVALSSSYGESLPIVLLEALACAVPVVATDVGDCRLIVDRFGIIVPPREPAKLADALDRVLWDDDALRVRVRAGARAHMEANYAAPQIVRRWGAMIDAAAGLTARGMSAPTGPGAV